jgi:ornithine--oxo-acid transaminase
LFVADEIQTGFGRTGKMFALDHEGVKPDVYILGKALSGGTLPISAVAATREVLGVFNPGDHGSTFGGSPLAAAVARAALRVIQDEGLCDRAAELGTYLIHRLKEMGAPHVKEIRGKGLLIGIEMTEEAGPARMYCERFKDMGVLCKDIHGKVIRLAPPLVVTKDELDWALERIHTVLVGDQVLA